MRDDEALAQEDPTIPGLLACLDAQELEVRLRAWGHEAEGTRVEYVRYKTQTSAVASLSTTIAGRRRWGALRAGSSTEERAAEKLAKHGEVRDDLLVLSWLEEDRSLPVLSRLRKDPGALQRELGLDEPPAWETLRYKPDRRWVASDRVHVLKGFSGDVPVSRRAHEGVPHVLQPLWHSRRDRLLVFPYVAGTHPTTGDEYETCGRLLRDLHASSGGARRAALLPEPGAAAAAVRAVVPSLAERAERLSVELGRLLPRLEEGDALLHGDFSPDQVLLTGAGPLLLDLDRSGRGHPGADVARFVVSLSVDGGASRGEVDAAREALLAGYGPELPSGELRTWEAAHLLAAAVAPFRSRRDGWREEASSILTAAEDRLGC